MTTSLENASDKPRTRTAVGAALVMLGLALVGNAATPSTLNAQTAPANPSSFTSTVPGQVILRLIPVPEPANLGDFVLDKSVAIQLGKAFFWDEQAGSDGSQACASCHFAAGADVRTRNQVNPGKDSTPIRHCPRLIFRCTSSRTRPPPAPRCFRTPTM